MENNSDIPFAEGPVDPQTGNYSFILPTRFNDDESNVVVQFPANTTREQAVAELRASFPRNSADTQVQKMTDPDWATKINAADYLQYKKEEDKYPKQKTDLYGILKETAADLLGSAVTIASESGKAAWNASPLTNALGIGDQRMAARHAWNIVEAGVQGNERLSMLGGLLGMKIGDVLTENPFKDTESSVESDLRRVQYAQEMGKILAARKAGNLATENNGDTPSYVISKPEGVPAATKADVDAANSMSNLLDVTMAIPGAAFTKIGEVAGNTMFKYVMPATLVETGLKAGFAASKVAGSALDATSRFIFNKISQVTEAVAEGAVTDAGKAIANYAAKGAMYGGLFMGPGGKLIGMSLGGKALKAIGEVGGAVMEGLEKGEVRAVLQELGENELKAATIRQAARIVSAIAPPDIAINAMKGALDSALNVGASMGGLGAMTAWASNDDPIRGFQEGMASGLGAGLVFGAAQVPFAMREAQQLKLINYFQNDLVGRPKEQSFDVTHPSGHTETVKFNDLQGRIDLFNRKDLTDRQKAMVIALGDAHERAGGSTIFVDSSPESIQKLNDIGFAGVKGVHMFDGTDGRSTILIAPKSVDAAVAAEEVMHSMFTEHISREVRDGVQAGLKQANPDAWIGEIETFANRYMNELELSGHADAAETMRAGIEAAKDPSVPLEDKIRYMDYAINEYISNYVGAAVHGMKPENLMQGPVTKNIWDKVWDKTVSNILSVFDFTKSGLSKEPISGHFFDERGKRVQMPELEGIVGRFVDAVREGRGEIYSKNTVDGAHYVDVRDTKPYVSYEDFADNKPTTLAQKKKIHKSAYEQNVAAASAIDPNLISVATPDVVESGKFGGNLGGLKNKRVLFSRELPDAFFGHLANQEVNGVKVYTNEQIQALRGINESIKAGHIVMTDAWHDIKRTKGDRTEVYYGRTNRPTLPISWQQTETGGLLVNQIDLGRVWGQMRHFAKHEPSLRAALNGRDIHTLVDVLPYFQLYFDNYSSGKPVPAAKLEAFDEALRDGISRALNIKNRTSYKAVDEARFVNQHTFDTEGFPSQPKPIVEVNGVQREVNRDRVSIQSIRADRIMGLNDFKVGGFNVPIKYDPELATNLIRANFTPGAIAFEKLPNGEILTDKVTGDKIIVKPTGKATLMQGERKSIHANVEEAVSEADKRSVAMFAPKGKGDDRLLYRNFKETFPNVEQMSSVERDVALRKWMREHSGVSPFELSGLGAQSLLKLQEAVRVAKPQTVNAEVKRSEEFSSKVKAHDSLMAKIRSAYKRAAEEPASRPSPKTVSTMDSLSTKPEAGNAVIAGAIDKAYIAGEVPLETVNQVKAKLSEAIDKNYVVKREEALETAKGNAPAMTAEEHIAQQEAELRSAGMRVPNYEATPEEMAAVDAQRHDTASALREKHLAQTAGINEKMQAGFAEKSDKQRMRLEEQTNRMLNVNRAEQLAAGARAIKRVEQERIAGRKQNVIEAFKADREAQKLAIEKAKAQEVAASYLKAQDLAKEREAAKSLERQQKGENIQRQADVTKLAERRRGMEELLTEQSKRQREFARQEAKHQKNTEKADKWHKKARAERAAEDARLLAEKEMQDKARYERNRQHANAMEELLKDQPTASLGDETPKGTKIMDKQIPRAVNILITPKLKFRIYLNGGALIGITDTYEQAIRTAKRHAA